MAEDKLSREEERRFLKILEQSTLQDYPNPERQGCPGADFLRQLASNRRSISLSDPRLDHLAHCSPCFREFTTFRRQARVRRRALIGSIAAIIAIAGILTLWRKPVALRTAPSEVTQNSHPAARNELLGDVSLAHSSVTRGGEEKPNAREPEIRRGDGLLRITLPIGSEAGAYEVQVLREAGKPLTTADGQAKIQDGSTRLEVRMDLSGLPPGKYLLGIRQPPWSWSFHPVLVR